ncbi:mitochondrial import receptor subunit TOM22 homolog [Branchiostoma floridae x Branchiostoma belcheri]
MLPASASSRQQILTAAFSFFFSQIMAEIEEIRRPEDELDDDDDIDDEDIEDETVFERLVGLTEMFPDSLRNGVSGVTSLSVSGTKWLYQFTRRSLWVVSTSFMILVLPVIFETEKAQMEQQQLQQQRQILLGPNAAVSGGMQGGIAGMPLPPGMQPQR